MYYERSSLITGRNEVLAKVMFLHVSVILLTGGGLPGRGGVPAWGGCLPGGGAPDQAPPPNTVNAQPVRILLECIFVLLMVSEHNKRYFYERDNVGIHKDGNV